jgi:hypothetical protein
MDGRRELVAFEGKQAYMSGISEATKDAMDRALVERCEGVDLLKDDVGSTPSTRPRRSTINGGDSESGGGGGGGGTN